MFKKAKKGAQLLGSTWKDGFKGLFHFARDLLADDIITTFKDASQIASNLSAGVKGASWVAEKFPIVGRLGEFGGTAAKGLDWTSNLFTQGTKLGQKMKGEKPTGVKHGWFDQINPFS